MIRHFSSAVRVTDDRLSAVFNFTYSDRVLSGTVVLEPNPIVDFLMNVEEFPACLYGFDSLVDVIPDNTMIGVSLNFYDERISVCKIRNDSSRIRDSCTIDGSDIPRSTCADCTNPETRS